MGRRLRIDGSQGRSGGRIRHARGRAGEPSPLRRGGDEQADRDRGSTGRPDRGHGAPAAGVAVGGAQRVHASDRNSQRDAAPRLDGEILGRMTESKGVKPGAPEQPHKPAPKIVAVRPLPTDYQVDPSDPFPIPTPTRARALVGKSAAKAGALAVAATVGPVGPVQPAPAPQTPVIRATRLSHSRDHKSLRIAHLYPSLLNVAG